MSLIYTDPKPIENNVATFTVLRETKIDGYALYDFDFELLYSSPFDRRKFAYAGDTFMFTIFPSAMNSDVVERAFWIRFYERTTRNKKMNWAKEGF